MSRAKIKRAEKADPSARHAATGGVTIGATNGASNGHGNTAVAAADFMLSIVEAHHTRKNGNVIKMDSGLKAQQELAKIEEQITRLQSVEGQNSETLRQIQQLHDRVNDLRREISLHLNAWERTELARHPQRPYTLDYVERIFTDWSEIHGDRGFSLDPFHYAPFQNGPTTKFLFLRRSAGRAGQSEAGLGLGFVEPRE